MGANNFTKYNKDFKEPLIALYKMVKFSPNSVKNTVFLNPPSTNGLRNSPPLRQMTAKFPQLNK